MSNIEIKFDNNIMRICDTNTGKIETTQITSPKINSSMKRLLSSGESAIPAHIWIRLSKA